MRRRWSAPFNTCACVSVVGLPVQMVSYLVSAGGTLEGGVLHQDGATSGNTRPAQAYEIKW